MKLALKIGLSLLVGAVCVWFVASKIDPRATLTALRRVSAGSIAVYVASLAATHFFRAFRWRILLSSIGVGLPPARLMAVSSVGFMAILALPFRLGEFVRPYLVARAGHSRMSAVLGTVAVERIVDGLVVSIIFFLTFLAAPGGAYPAGLRVTAWLSLAAFAGATLFLVFALRWPDATVRWSLRASLLSRLAPRLAARTGDRLAALIRGFGVLRQPKSLLLFLFESILYWGVNGLGMWLLARSMELDVSLAAAFAVMAFTGVLITLPNSPGLVGQFHAGIMLALGAYLPAAVVAAAGGAYAIVLHGIQLVWYVGVGLLALAFVDDGARGWRDVLAASKRAAEAAEGGSEA